MVSIIKRKILEEGGEVWRHDDPTGGLIWHLALPGTEPVCRLLVSSDEHWCGLWYKLLTTCPSLYKYTWPSGWCCSHVYYITLHVILDYVSHWHIRVIRITIWDRTTFITPSNTSMPWLSPSTKHIIIIATIYIYMTIVEIIYLRIAPLRF